MTYEAEMIALEQTFWQDNVLAKVPPPYTEDGDLILESLRRKLGPSEKDTPPVMLGLPQYSEITRYLELQHQKNELNKRLKQIDGDMNRLKALLVEAMGTSCLATYQDADRQFIPVSGERIKETDHIMLFGITLQKIEMRLWGKGRKHFFRNSPYYNAILVAGVGAVSYTHLTGSRPVTGAPMGSGSRSGPWIQNRHPPR